MTPLEAAIDRLTYEAAYVRDVLFLAGPGGSCRVSAAAMQNLYAGLAAVVEQLRKIQPLPAPGGPAAPPAGGG